MIATPLTNSNFFRMACRFACLFLFAPLQLPAQSFITDLLFQEANVVFKGKVTEIHYSMSDAEGDDFVVETSVDKVYKNNFSGDHARISVTKLYEIDTVRGDMRMIDFQIAKGHSYIFFVQRIRKSDDTGRYFTRLADSQIEGIPFSDELELALAKHRDYSVFKARDYSAFSYKLLVQSSPVVQQMKIRKIKSRKGQHLVYGTTPAGKKVLVKTESLHCVCKDSVVQKGESYWFFLTPDDDGKFLLSDKWLGVFQASSVNRNVIDYYRPK